MRRQTLESRTAKEVFADHLANRQRGDLDADLRRNYAADVVMLTARGVLHGHDGVRRSAALLYQAVREAKRYEVEAARCGERMAFLEWTAEGAHASIRDGVDSFLIEDGRIVAQTIHYTVTSRELSVSDLADRHRGRSPSPRRIAEAPPSRSSLR